MDRQLILGSNSPRRKEIMDLAGYSFDIVVSNEEEIVNPQISLYEIPEDLAKQKAEHILPQIHLENFVLITADTVVILNEKIIGKPVDRDDAFRILQALSGEVHEVVSGVCITDGTERHCFSDLTTVTFATMSEAEIENYIRHYEVMDKAGAYAIQEGIGLTSVESINGSYYNVMGLPIHKVYRRLTDMDIHPNRDV